MKKLFTVIESTQRRRVLGVVASAVVGVLAWKRFFRVSRHDPPDRPGKRTDRVTVTINPLAIPRKTATGQENG